ncbi:Y9801-like protein [Mya arenaria]|uniref:Y9801-like protein n=1 Tax=Mya arenaria TaxID=6604 RepID=A0ABY7E5G6_MYAAR|nr:Y9801-like protein [Mya arenaria]
MERLKSIQFGSEIYSRQHLDDLPLVEIGPLNDEIIASYSGPDSGLAFGLDNRATSSDGEIAGARNWNMKDQKAYGICISLYEQHPVNGKMSVADAFAICARGNNCVMVIADGVNWGEKSRLAARAALYGAMDYINTRIFTNRRSPASTHDVFAILRKSFDKAHQEILDREGGLTTLCACMVCPVAKSTQEVTQGSHDVSLVRDIRDAGGAIGPVDGKNPELHNLTYGLSFANPGDIVFLTTDGISDNYDPVVTKIAVAPLTSVKNENEQQSEGENHYECMESTSDPGCSSICGKPIMEPQERHIYAMKEMERVLHDYELITEEDSSAQELCSAMVQHVLMTTDQKRKVLENPDLYRRKKLSLKDKQTRDSQIVSKMSEAPGKLDHASIVSYEVGEWKQDFDTMDSIPLESQTSESSSSSKHSTNTDISYPKSPTSPSHNITSPSSGTKKIRPKKLFNKLKNNLNIKSTPNSPTTEQSPSISNVTSPKKYHFKRSRTKSEAGALSPSSPVARRDVMSSGFEDFRYQASPTSHMPVSPTSPSRLPYAGHQYQQYRKPAGFESAV